MANDLPKEGDDGDDDRRHSAGDQHKLGLAATVDGVVVRALELQRLPPPLSLLSFPLRFLPPPPLPPYDGALRRPLPNGQRDDAGARDPFRTTVVPIRSSTGCAYSDGDPAHAITAEARAFPEYPQVAGTSL